MMWLGNAYWKAGEWIKGVFRNEEGQGMVEYGLILALIAVVVIAALSFLGDEVAEIFNDIGDTIKDVDVENGTD